MERSGRLTVCLVALILSLPLFVKGRVFREEPGGAAFLLSTSGTVLLRLAGDFPRPGVYPFPDGFTVTHVTKMTLYHPLRKAQPALPGESLLLNGNILTLTVLPGDTHLLSLKKMETAERMLFGIPLHPDEMGECDWEALPGIGPALAERIVTDRQKNGTFGSLQGVLRVPGIGPRTISRIRKYF